MAKNSYTAIVEKEGDLYVALCPELDVASQGATIEGATSNLKEAVELFLETADAAEIKHRLHTEVFITRFEQRMGKLRVLSGRDACKILENTASTRKQGLASLPNERCLSPFLFSYNLIPGDRAKDADRRSGTS